MQESYCEELAPHTGRQSYVTVREGSGEALTEVGMGRVFSRKTVLQGADIVAETEGNIKHSTMAGYAHLLFSWYMFSSITINFFNNFLFF